MTAFSVKFYGGPLAGQVHMIDNPPRRYKIPSYTRVSVTTGSGPIDCPPSFEIEEYELGPAHGMDHTYTYTWINPAEELRRYLKEQREATERYRQQTLELKAEVERLTPKAEAYEKILEAASLLGGPLS